MNAGGHAVTAAGVLWVVREAVKVFLPNEVFPNVLLSDRERHLGLQGLKVSRSWAWLILSMRAGASVYCEGRRCDASIFEHAGLFPALGTAIFPDHDHVLRLRSIWIMIMCSCSLPPMPLSCRSSWPPSLDASFAAICGSSLPRLRDRPRGVPGLNMKKRTPTCKRATHESPRIDHSQSTLISKLLTKPLTLEPQPVNLLWCCGGSGFKSARSRSLEISGQSKLAMTTRH